MKLCPAGQHMHVLRGRLSLEVHQLPPATARPPLHCGYRRRCIVNGTPSSLPDKPSSSPYGGSSPDVSAFQQLSFVEQSTESTQFEPKSSRVRPASYGQQSGSQQASASSTSQNGLKSHSSSNGSSKGAPTKEDSNSYESHPSSSDDPNASTSTSSSTSSTSQSAQESSYSNYYRTNNTSIPRPTTSTEPPETSFNGSSPHGWDIAGMSSRTSDNGTSTSSSSMSVAEALARAQQALDKVESSLDDIERLPSAQPETQLDRILKLIRTTITVGSLCVAMVASHAFGLGLQWFGALVGACGIAGWGYKKSSLAVSGAIAALFVGGGTLGCSLRFGATLLAFFFSSSKLTQYKEELKAGLDEHTKKGGQRDWVQVLCNALVPTVLAIAYGVLAGCVDVPLGPSPAVEPWRSQLITLLMGGFLGYYACCCGDTWASELGPLSADTPRLITTLRPVRKGTNGGVTLLGLSASIFGGMFIGLVFYLAAIVSPTLWIFEQQRMAAVAQWRLIPLGLMAGLVGSVLDSLLGATLQFTGYNRVTGKVTSKPGPDVIHISGTPFLDNNMVNAASATITGALTALVAVKMFGC